VGFDEIGVSVFAAGTVFYASWQDLSKWRSVGEFPINSGPNFYCHFHGDTLYANVPHLSAPSNVVEIGLGGILGSTGLVYSKSSFDDVYSVPGSVVPEAIKIVPFFEIGFDPTSDRLVGWAEPEEEPGGVLFVAKDSQILLSVRPNGQILGSSNQLADAGIYCQKICKVPLQLNRYFPYFINFDQRSHLFLPVFNYLLEMVGEVEIEVPLEAHSARINPFNMQQQDPKVVELTDSVGAVWRVYSVKGTVSADLMQYRDKRKVL
jgi:hypothetical protein